MFEDKTQSNILTGLLNNCNSSLNKNEGGFLFDCLAPMSVEMAQAYINMLAVINLMFLETTSGIYLDYKAVERGIARKEATLATGVVTVSGVNGTVIPIGTRFATVGGVAFVSTSEGVIANGVASVNMEAMESGVSGNVPANTVTQIIDLISGVTTCNNSNGITGGSDIETDEALKQRILNKIRKPSASGNANDYVNWALTVNGVGRAKCLPIWNGNGTVKVVLITSECRAVSNTVIDDADDYITSVKPIGCTLTVASAQEVDIDVSVEVTLLSGYTLEGVQADIEAQITNYLKNIAFNSDVVSIARIGNAILDAEGVLDYANLTINSGTSNITIDDDEVAVLGTVVLV